MASILALSMIWMNNCSHSLAWSPPRMPSAKSSTHQLTHQHTCISHHSSLIKPTTTALLSSIQEDITVNLNEEKLLQELTIPELKERLRSNGQKVCAYYVCMMYAHDVFMLCLQLCTHITYTINI